MAHRRMIAVRIVDSQAFLDMPASAQLLYLHMLFRADDDGFIGNPKIIMRMIGASKSRMQMLLDNQLVIAFESGVCVIRHWRVHNYIPPDRYTETMYKQEKRLLTMDENNAYALADPPSDGPLYTECRQNVSIPYTQVRLGKGRLGKESTGEAERALFSQPSIPEIAAFCAQRNNGIDPEGFFAYYDARGWMLSDAKPMVSWKSAVITWEKRDKARAAQGAQGPQQAVRRMDEFDE